MTEFVTDIPSLIDFAVGTSEINFKLLHTVLHIFASQLPLRTTKIVLRDDYATTVADLTRRSPHDLAHVVEHKVVKGGEEVPFDLAKCALVKKDVDRFPIITNVIELELNESIAKTPLMKNLSMEDYQKLWDKVNLVHDLISTGMTDSLRLVQSTTKEPGVLEDLMGILNMTKRISALEVAMEKLNNLFACLNNKLEEIMKLYCDRLTELLSRFDTLDKTLKSLDDRLNTLAQDIDQRFEDFQNKLDSVIDDIQAYHLDQGECNENEALAEDLNSKYADLLNMFEKLRRDTEKRISHIPPRHNNELATGHHGIASHGIHDVNQHGVTGLEAQDINASFIEKYLEDFVKDLMDKIDRFEEEVCRLQKEVAVLCDKVEQILACNEFTDKKIEDLRYNMQYCCKDLKCFVDRVKILMLERQQRKEQVEVVIEQIEHVKTMKANFEDLQIMQATKANLTDLRRKVDMTTFTVVKRDVIHTLGYLCDKVTCVYNELKTSVIEINETLDEKIDKKDLDIIYQYIDYKLKDINDRLCALEGKKKECDSVAITMNYLKDVTCISCQADTAQNRTTEKPLIKKLEPMGNVNEFKKLITTIKRKQNCPENLKVNRYVGGAHTTTTAKERLIQSKGPMPTEFTKPLLFTYCQGTDGNLYRVDPRRCECFDEPSDKGSLECPPKKGLHADCCHELKLRPKTTTPLRCYTSRQSLRPEMSKKPSTSHASVRPSKEKTEPSKDKIEPPQESPSVAVSVKPSQASPS